MTVTLDPTLEATVVRFANEQNLQRLKNKDGEYVDPPQTAGEILTANLNAIVQSWKDMHNAIDRALMTSAADTILAAGAGKTKEEIQVAVQAGVTAALALLENV